jgi:hypothetical protein
MRKYRIVIHVIWLKTKHQAYSFDWPQRKKNVTLKKQTTIIRKIYNNYDSWVLELGFSHCGHLQLQTLFVI